MVDNNDVDNGVCDDGNESCGIDGNGDDKHCGVGGWCLICSTPTT